MPCKDRKSFRSVVNWDENHFTEKASKFIFSKFIDDEFLVI